MLNNLTSNTTLFSAFCGWFLAQLIKVILYAVINKKFKAERFWGTGGMPSSHSAAVSALAVSAALKYGFDSFQFSISSVFAIVVMRDASGIRKQAGEHAKILNQMLGGKNLKELLGHTLLQVIVGLIIGTVVALLLHSSTLHLFT